MSAAGDGLRLALVSPLPPAASGIADYVADLLPLLPESWRIDVFTVDPAPGRPPEGVDGNVRDLAEASPGSLDAYDLCVYQVGNGAEHARTMELAVEHPGLLVLHDPILHPARIHAHAAAGDLDGYRSVARRARPDVGERLGSLVAAGLWGPSTYWTFPLCEDLVRASRLTVVHGEWTARWLRALVAGARIETVEHWRAVPEVEPEAVSGWRERLGAGPETPLIGSFGHVGPAHGTGALLEAAAALRSEHDFRVAIVGSVDPSLRLTDRVAELGLEDRFHATGRVPAPDFAALMRAVDLAVNLRYPTARASSGTLQQLMQVGTPTLVHDLIHLRDLPGPAVIRVPPGPREVERKALTSRLAGWLADPEARGRSSEACRAWARERITPERMAASYRRAVESALRQPEVA